MKHLDLTLPTPQENLACDDALLELCEEGFDHEILRFWEPREYFVVLGRSGKMEAEVHVDSCKENRIPILRRSSGGGTVLQGPGCLNFSLILRMLPSGPLKSISQTNTFVMNYHKEALERILGNGVEVQGTSDLTLRGLKFSGNAQRRKRHFVLFHGTFLCHFDIPLIEKFLRVPLKQPAYRKNRLHQEFLTNLCVSPSLIRSALQKAWQAGETFDDLPAHRVRELAKNRYAKDEWNFKL